MSLGGVVWSILALLALIGAIWVIYDVIVKQRQMSRTKRTLWIVFAAVFSLVTAIVYYLLVTLAPKKKKK
jgi:ABC-type polysaccharide/polyol phosphate export permease